MTPVRDGAGHGVERLVLFDIDGTLVRGGPAKTAFQSAMIEVYGTAGPIEEHDFSGKTDPQIARELLERVGMSTERIRAGLGRLWAGYLQRLETGLRDRPVTVLPGVTRLLDALESRRGVRLGLVTGNVEHGARLKLGSAGLAERFTVGAYGSDHEERNRLPGLAMARAAEAWGRTFGHREVVIVGDTPRDVECGRWHGVRTVGVATGRWSAEQLGEAGAERVLPDFGELAEALDAVLDPTAGGP